MEKQYIRTPQSAFFTSFEENQMKYLTVLMRVLLATCLIGLTFLWSTMKWWEAGILTFMYGGLVVYALMKYREARQEIIVKVGTRVKFHTLTRNGFPPDLYKQVMERFGFIHNIKIWIDDGSNHHSFLIHVYDYPDNNLLYAGFSEVSTNPGALTVWSIHKGKQNEVMHMDHVKILHDLLKENLHDKLTTFKQSAAA